MCLLIYALPLSLPSVGLPPSPLCRVESVGKRSWYRKPRCCGQSPLLSGDRSQEIRKDTVCLPYRATERCTSYSGSGWICPLPCCKNFKEALWVWLPIFLWKDETPVSVGRLQGEGTRAVASWQGLLRLVRLALDWLGKNSGSQAVPPVTAHCLWVRSLCLDL